MVVSNNTKTNGKWLRKYRLFFVIGLILLVSQVFLAARFLQINNNKSSSVQNDWQPQSEEPSARIPSGYNQKKSNASSLRLEELDFKPECEITRKEAVSAIHRAKTQQCKQLIANVSCQSVAGTLYPQKIDGKCPSGGRKSGKALGCFKDETSFRLLRGYYGVNKGANSPQYCMNLCLQSGFEYAGVQYGYECFCGNDEPPSTSKLPDSSCNMKCPGEGHAICGGYYTLNIYETGIQKFVAQIASTGSPDVGQRSAKIVFLLTLHGRSLRQVRRLLKILYHKDHYYYIHVDVREDYLFRELLPLERRFDNIRLTRRRFATIWGGSSLLQMLLHCFSEVLTLWHWDYVLNLSESDYPVKTVRELTAFLTLNAGRNFVKSHGRDTQRFLQKQGLDKTFIECDRRMWRVGDRTLPQGVQMDGGSDWVALSRSFVEYIARPHSDQLVAGLKQIYQYTLLPAESFFHTALRNSEYCTTYIDNNLHVTNWKRKLGCKCQHKHVVDWCGCSPNDFRLDDWNRIQSTQSRQLFFARKFEPIVNQAVLLKLELWLHGLDQPARTFPGLNSYWQSVYDVRDLSPKVDDALFTALNAAIRVWVRNLGNQSCIVDHGQPLQAIFYHHQDSYRNTLVYFKTSVAGGIELAFKPVNTTYLVAPSVWAKRIEELTVSTDYDQKEQMSRNFPRIISPFSDPVLIYKFTAIDSHLINKTITTLWIDPTGSAADFGEILIDDANVIGFAKMILKQPHLPGTWTVKLLQNRSQIAEVKFLVTPLEFYNSRPVSDVKEARLIHGGSKNPRPVMDSFYGKYVTSPFDTDILRSLSIKNAEKIDDRLRDWIDTLFGSFYKIDRMCGVGGEREICGVKLRDCKQSAWSSFAPDPKSEIGEINSETGMFDIW